MFSDTVAVVGTSAATAVLSLGNTGSSSTTPVDDAGVVVFEAARMSLMLALKTVSLGAGWNRNAVKSRAIIVAWPAAATGRPALRLVPVADKTPSTSKPSSPFAMTDAAAVAPPLQSSER